MVLLLRTLARFVTFVLLVALALAGLVIAIFSIGGGESAVSLHELARYVRLPELRDEVGDYLARLEEDGPVATYSALAGVAAVVVGVLLLVGALAPRRERLVILEESEGGRLAAQRRTLSKLAEALVEQARGVTEAKARLRTSRWNGSGRLTVLAMRPRSASAQATEEKATQALAPLAEEFGLKPRVRSRLGTGKARVQ